MNWYRCVEDECTRRDRDLPLYVVVCSRCVEAEHAIIRHYRFERVGNRPWHCAICGQLEAPHTKGDTLFDPLDVAWSDRAKSLGNHCQTEAVDSRTKRSPE
jgi:hypothetical protein